jgi:hypothetical protein
MRTRLLRGLVALLATVAVSLVLLPGTSYAASGLDNTGGGFKSGMNVWEAYRPSGAWRVGDCSMLGGYSPTGAPEDTLSRARIVQPDANGQSWVYIFEATETFASPTDVWWTTLTFYTRFGTPMLTTPKIKGAAMTSTNFIYTDTAGAPVTIDPELYALIDNVTWVVSC